MPLCVIVVVIISVTGSPPSSNRGVFIKERGLLLFPSPVLSGFYSCIFALLFKISLIIRFAVGSVIFAGYFLFRFLDFRYHALQFLFGRLGKFGQFVFKRADVIKMHFDVLDCISCPFCMALMYDKFTDKLITQGD